MSELGGNVELINFRMPHLMDEKTKGQREEVTCPFITQHQDLPVCSDANAGAVSITSSLYLSALSFLLSDLTFFPIPRC